MAHIRAAAAAAATRAVVTTTASSTATSSSPATPPATAPTLLPYPAIAFAAMMLLFTALTYPHGNRFVAAFVVFSVLMDHVTAPCFARLARHIEVDEDTNTGSLGRRFFNFGWHLVSSVLMFSYAVASDCFPPGTWLGPALNAGLPGHNQTGVIPASAGLAWDVFYGLGLAYHGRKLRNIKYDGKGYEWVVHHWVTVALIVGSHYPMRLGRMGHYVMLLHDLSDVPSGALKVIVSFRRVTKHFPANPHPKSPDTKKMNPFHATHLLWSVLSTALHAAYAWAIVFLRLYVLGCLIWDYGMWLVDGELRPYAHLLPPGHVRSWVDFAIVAMLVVLWGIHWLWGYWFAQLGFTAQEAH